MTCSTNLAFSQLREGGGRTRHKKEHLWSKAEKKTKLRATHLLPHTHHRQEESLPHQIQNSATKPLVTAPCPTRYTPQDCLRQIKSLRAESQGCIPSAPPTTSLLGSPGSNRNPFSPRTGPGRGRTLRAPCRRTSVLEVALWHSLTLLPWNSRISENRKGEEKAVVAVVDRGEAGWGWG